MPTPDSRSLSDVHTPIEPDFDPKVALQQAAAQRAAAAGDSLSERKTTGGIVGDSTSSADLKAAADHLDDVEFEFVDLSRLYDIGEPLGEGGMGTVYRAIEKQSRHPLAIKRLKSDLVANRHARARFQSEGNAMLKLTHENIVRFFRMGCDAGSPFYVMELVAGGSLKDRLEQGKLELDEAVRMFVALAGGLSLSHRTGIIHRDIKPGNILLTLDGVPKLSDFGIARQVEGSGLTSTGAAMGTPFYMAPEQHKDGKTATELSDLYSLAATLYHAVSGEPPISIRESRIPEPIRELTLKALEADPGQRQPSVAEFGTELRAVQMQLSGPASATDNAAQLKAGECPHCHTINPTSRKFCQKKGCAKPLVEPCPKCETPSPVWEAICAECGTDIPAHWEAAEQDLQNQAQQIETLAAEQRYAEALESLKPFYLLTEARWKAWKDWANETAATYQAQLAEQQAHRDRLLSEAQEVFKAAKYSLVISLLDQIHPLQVTQEVGSLRSLATACLEELDQLIRDIKQQVSTKDYAGLRRNVDRVLTISPGDHRVTKLEGELRVREEAEKRKQEQQEIERQKQEAIRREQQREADRLAAEQAKRDRILREAALQGEEQLAKERAERVRQEEARQKKIREAKRDAEILAAKMEEMDSQYERYERQQKVAPIRTATPAIRATDIPTLEAEAKWRKKRNKGLIGLTLFGIIIGFFIVVFTSQPRSPEITPQPSLQANRVDLNPTPPTPSLIAPPEMSAREIYELAEKHLEGKDVPKDTTEALRLFKKSYDMGYRGAASQVAKMYRDGVGVKADWSTVAEWYEKIHRNVQAGTDIDRALSNSAYELGDLYQTGGPGLPANPFTAVKWYKVSAEVENIFGNLSKIRLGDMYLKGEGVARDPAQAVKWFESAAIMGEFTVLARYSLAVMYRDGDGVPKDTNKAKHWFKGVLEDAEEEGFMTTTAREYLNSQ